jgi:hypothetical protein
VRLSAAARVQRPAVGPEASAQQAAGAAGLAGAAAEARQQGEEAQAAAAAQRLAAELRASVAVAVRQPGAAAPAGVAEEVPRQVAAARDAAVVVLRPAEAAPVLWERLRVAALPSAVPSVCRRDRLRLSLAQQPAALSAHARRGLRIASPSGRSWQAARDEVWS